MEPNQRKPDATFDVNGKKIDNTMADLEKNIEAEVERLVGLVGGTVQDVLQGVSHTITENGAENLRRFGGDVRNFVQNLDASIRAQTNSVTRTRNDARPQREKGRANHPYAPVQRQPYTQASMRQPEWAKHLTHGAGGSARVLTQIGTFFLGFLAICLGIGAVAVGAASTVGAPVWVAMMLAAFTGAAAFGGTRLAESRKSRERLERYAAQLEGRSYCTIFDLSVAVSRTPKFVRKDLKRMLQKGLFRSACLSPDEQKLFASTQAYRDYEGANIKDPVQPLPEPEQEFQTEGVQFLRELRAQKTHVDDPAVLAELEKIDQKTQSIYAWVKKNPASAGAVRRFTSYYLPTVLKLLKTYNEVDSHAADSTVATQIQNDIVGVLHTVNLAFSKLQDSLLADTAMSTSVEISALQTVLAQEGLTEEGLH